MSLSGFIRGHHEEIISEFALFAKTLMPPGLEMTEAELRDHAEDILTAVVQDMSIAQSPEEQSLKSRGRGAAKTMESSGTLHADDRIQHGFTFRAVLAEFRALRATVLRLYEKSGESDLTDVRRFNEAIDETMTESMDRFAVQTDLFRDQFIGVLSHDLRTPLGAVTAGAALLAVPEDNPERRGRVVTRIMNSAQRMERMIGDLLDLTRTRLGGSLPLKRRPADLQQVCEEAMMEIRAGQPDAVLQLQVSGDLRGEWDADRLGQVVSNLVGNAIQHGNGTPITLSGQEQGNFGDAHRPQWGPTYSRRGAAVRLRTARSRTRGRCVTQHWAGLVHRAGDRVGTRRTHSGEFIDRYRNDVHDRVAKG